MIELREEDPFEIITNPESRFQCSMCGKAYEFKEFMDLESVWVDKKHKQWGKTAVCECGTRMDERWQIVSRKDIFEISTVHLQGSALGIALTDMDNNYWYETMVLNTQNKKWLDFQMRYKTRKQAIDGHKDTYNKLENIILHPDKHPQGIIASFCNFLEAGRNQMETMDQKTKENLK